MLFPSNVVSTVAEGLISTPAAYSVWHSIEASNVFSFVSVVMALFSLVMAYRALDYSKKQAEAANKANLIAEQAKQQSEAANEISQTANEHGVQSLEIAKEANKLSRQANEYSELSHEREMGRGFVDLSVALVPVDPETNEPKANTKDLMANPINWFVQIDNRGPGTAFKLHLELLICDISRAYSVEELRGGSSTKLTLKREHGHRINDFIEERSDDYWNPAPWEVPGMITVEWRKFDGSIGGAPQNRNPIPLLFSNHPSQK